MKTPTCASMFLCNDTGLEGLCDHKAAVLTNNSYCCNRHCISRGIMRGVNISGGGGGGGGNGP